MSTKVSDYDFDFPQELVAQFPANPKDSSKLLVYERKNDKITHTTFNKILDFIPKNTHVMLNDTKVIKARIFGEKENKGKIELLFQKPLNENDFLVNIRGRVKKDSILSFENNIKAQVICLNEDGTRVVKFIKDSKILNFVELLAELEKIGHIPLPPYIKRSDISNDANDYQPIFASNEGAVAAPTASLHFTDELFKKLKESFSTHYLTLHVGIGTFKPVSVDDIANHAMHSEYFDIPSETKKIIDSNEKILAVGTTVARTIEFYARTKMQKGECNLFLNPNNPPIRVNHLLTNFHLPKSTLIMLVSAFIGREKTLELYNEAIKHKYRLFSYGDAMLVL
ncbi:MAG: S-adenosylmethionine:tRNA ribosyltransferase-isomerase [Campylobacterota bacterium]|nr:S-adenosylmethionine:tRNA ribosyltransferase-isomerase [Campylobacterota bacterium]